MKKLVTILIAFAAMTLTLSAQEKSIRYRGAVEIDGGITTLKETGDPVWDYAGALVVTTQGIEINRCLTIAAGLGIGGSRVARSDGETDPEIGGAVTIFLHTDYAFMKDSDFRPYVSARAGMLGSQGVSGLSCGLGAGVYALNHWKLGVSLSRFIASSDNLKGTIPYFSIGYRF